MCNLTDAGKQACTAMHIPSELEATGTVNTWSWGKAIETLSKMASLDGTTPRKLDKTDFSSLNTDTPVVSGTGATIRSSKRRLN